MTIIASLNYSHKLWTTCNCREKVIDTLGPPIYEFPVRSSVQRGVCVCVCIQTQVMNIRHIHEINREADATVVEKNHLTDRIHCIWNPDYKILDIKFGKMNQEVP